MPKSPTATRAVLSPRLAAPYLRNDNTIKAIDFAGLDIGSPKDITAPDSARNLERGVVGREHEDENDDPSLAHGCLTSASTTAGGHSNSSGALPPMSIRHLAIASMKVNEPSYWTLKGDFLRNGIHVYSKSGKHVIEDPLNYFGKNVKPPRWLQVQFNVVVPEESYWTCDIILKDMGGLPCGKDVLIAVQTGGVSVE